MVSEEIGNHKRGEDGASLVYPVFSRRSGGLSLGINLFPNQKLCNFDCPYCEVYESGSKTFFDTRQLERALKDFFEHSYPDRWAGVQIKDICISGNGEPTISPHLYEALKLCAECRQRYASIAGSSELVIITNSTGFLDKDVSALLAHFVEKEGLKIWAKLDSGTQEGFSVLSRSEYRLKDIVEGIHKFAVAQPIILQTMLCRLNGQVPGEREAAAYAGILKDLLSKKAKIEAIQLYTIARSTADDSIQALSDREMLEYAALLETKLENSPPILLFGRNGALKVNRK